MDQLGKDLDRLVVKGMDSKALYKRVCKYLMELSTYRASGLTPEEATELGEAERDGRLVVLPPPGGDDFALGVVFRHIGEFYDASTKSVGNHNELLCALSHLACSVAEDMGVSYRELLFSMSQQPSVAELVEADVTDAKIRLER